MTLLGPVTLPNCAELKRPTFEELEESMLTNFSDSIKSGDINDLELFSNDNWTQAREQLKALLTLMEKIANNGAACYSAYEIMTNIFNCIELIPNHPFHER